VDALDRLHCHHSLANETKKKKNDEFKLMMRTLWEKECVSDWGMCV
jgi:hypothetical protein